MANYFPNKLSEIKNSDISNISDFILTGISAKKDISDKVRLRSANLTSRAEYKIEETAGFGSADVHERADEHYRQEDIRTGHSFDEVPEDDGERDYE